MGMETHEWRKNKAVTDRLYYTEQTLKTFWGFQFFYSWANAIVRAKGLPGGSVLRPLKYVLAATVIVPAALLSPLTRFEIEQQWRKRVYMGKFLYTLHHLESAEALAENKTNGNRFSIL